MDEMLLIDPWRLLHPDQFHYTWHRTKPKPVFSRLDYFLINYGLYSQVCNIDILPAFKSDHCLVQLQLELSDCPRGPGVWKLNTSTPEDENYQIEVRKHIKTYLTYQMAPSDKWEALKCQKIQVSKDY